MGKELWYCPKCKLVAEKPKHPCDCVAFWRTLKVWFYGHNTDVVYTYKEIKIGEKLKV